MLEYALVDHCSLHVVLPQFSEYTRMNPGFSGSSVVLKSCSSAPITCVRSQLSARSLQDASPQLGDSTCLISRLSPAHTSSSREYGYYAMLYTTRHVSYALTLIIMNLVT